MDRPPKSGPEAGVLRIGDIVSWLQGRPKEPPGDLLSADSAAEADKSASGVPRPFVSDKAEWDITDPRVREWIDREYRRATGVPIETEKPLGPLATSGTDEETVGELHQCPSCGQSLSRSDVLRREWGEDMAKASDIHELLGPAGDLLWAHALENFKAFHVCERVPSQKDVTRDWRRLAVRKVLLYAIGFWAVGMVINFFGLGEDARRWTFPDALLYFVVCVLFFAVGVPLFLLLSMPLIDEELRAVWAEKTRREWEDWKVDLVKDDRIRKRERQRWERKSTG